MRPSVFLSVLFLICGIGCGGGAPQGDGPAGAKNPKDPGAAARPLDFKPAMLQFTQEAKRLTDLVEPLPAKETYSQKLAKVKAHFARIPKAPAPFEPQFKAAQQVLADFAVAEATLDFVHELLSMEAQAEADRNLDQFKDQSRGIKKKLEEIDAAMRK